MLSLIDADFLARLAKETADKKEKQATLELQKKLDDKKAGEEMALLNTKINMLKLEIKKYCVENKIRMEYIRKQISISKRVIPNHEYDIRQLTRNVNSGKLEERKSVLDVVSLNKGAVLRKGVELPIKGAQPSSNEHPDINTNPGKFCLNLMNFILDKVIGRMEDIISRSIFKDGIEVPQTIGALKAYRNKLAEAYSCLQKLISEADVYIKAQKAIIDARIVDLSKEQAILGTKAKAADQAPQNLKSNSEKTHSKAVQSVVPTAIRSPSSAPTPPLKIRSVLSTPSSSLATAPLVPLNRTRRLKAAEGRSWKIDRPDKFTSNVNSLTP